MTTNRNVKYRAWDKKRNAMCELTTNIFSGAKTLMFNDAIEGLQEDYVFMEYTGLKDKAGKEIYEGDVIASIAYNGGLFDRREVKYVEHNADRDFGTGGIFMGFNIPGKNIEIMGNIYENPELLNHD